MVLKIAETNIPIKEMVMILLVSAGKLNDKIDRLKLLPPKNMGNHPRMKSKIAAVAQDQ